MTKPVTAFMLEKRVPAVSEAGLGFETGIYQAETSFAFYPFL